jgi:putative ABC transport system substrate-binding protein
VKRRTFITLLGGMAASWPLATRAQQAERVRKVGYLSPGKVAPNIEVFFETLRRLGWIEGKNISFEIRSSGENDADGLARMAAELVRLNMDVIVARARSGRSPPNELPQRFPS